MYEYVTKKEYGPIKNEIETILYHVKHEMENKYELTFRFQLIGSGKRHLITRVIKGNRGYDFDYNLIIPHPGQGYHYKSNVIKKDFISAFKTALKNTKYSFPKDSKSAITIKLVDKNNSKILHSCDFAIIYYDENKENEGYYYLRNNKSQNQYQFVFRSLRLNIDDKVEDIVEYCDGWNYIRQEYLKLKNINEGNRKHSFSLYNEAVNNVYNRMFND